MKFFVLILALAASVTASAADKAACIAKYDVVSDSTDTIFYYEIAKYDFGKGKFETLKQWYCEDIEVDKEMPKMLKENCTIINIDGVAIAPSADGSFNLTFGCG
ncbi:MAG: hypothetical protein AAF203_10285 [Pseudomonadota bacterium]